jgi:hypothetical protein
VKTGYLVYTEFDKSIEGVVVEEREAIMLTQKDLRGAYSPLAESFF